MNDVNMADAHTAGLRSIASPTGLSCDAPSAAPDETLVEEFRRAMDDAGRGGGESLPRGAHAGGDLPADTPLPPSSAGEAAMPFASLFSMGTAMSCAPAEAAGPAYPPLPPDALESLVDRILVSSAEGGSREVRLILSDRILSGTEIIVRRSFDGQLAVCLHCTSESTFQTLTASQAALRERLEDFENRSVQVSVDIDRERGDADRRSRGLREPDQQES